MEFQPGDLVVCFSGGMLCVARVLAVEADVEPERTWLVVQEPYGDDPEDAELYQRHVPARDVYLIQSTRRAFLDDVLRSVAYHVGCSVVGHAQDRYWIEQSDRSPGDESDEQLVALAREARRVTWAAREAADELVGLVQGRLRENFAGQSEAQQVTSWEAGIDYWLGYSSRAPHGAPRRRDALLMELRRGQFGEEAYAALIAGTRALRGRCDAAIERLGLADDPGL
jgi:hypothetical protein